MKINAFISHRNRKLLLVMVYTEATRVVRGGRINAVATGFRGQSESLVADIRV